MLHLPHFIKTVLAATVLTMLLPAANAQAAILFSGSSRGTFGEPLVDPSIDSEATFRVENPTPQTEAFLLGAPGPDSVPNQLAFTGEEFSVATQQSFSVGTLTYQNGQTFQGTNVSGVPLSISLNLAQPSQAQRSFDYQFTFSLTPNIEQVSSADNLVISENPDPQSFSIGEESFSIELLGFSSDNGATFTRSLQVAEDQSISSILFAQIEAESVTIGQPESPNGQPIEVPEPALLSGLFVIFAAVKLSEMKSAV